MPDVVARKSGVVVRAGVRAVRAGCCVASAGVPFFALKGLGGCGWLMFEKVLAAFMAWIFSI